MLESRFLDAAESVTSVFDIVGPTLDDRRRAAELARQLVTAPLGYVDAAVIAIAERLKILDIATVDFKFWVWRARSRCSNRFASSFRSHERTRSPSLYRIPFDVL